MLKFLLRMLRSKHYVGAKDLAGAADTAQKKASAGNGPAGMAEMLEIPLPVLIANVLVQVMKVGGCTPDSSSTAELPSLAQLTTLTRHSCFRRT